MTQSFVPELDHVVINVLGDLDAAQRKYAALGFNLQPRGHHSHGSSNHLAVFGQTYLELLGYEPGRETLRADLWKAPAGLTGLVFKTNDSLALHAHLQALGLDGDAPSEFHRPVTLPDGTDAPAKFRTVRLASHLVPNGRAFFCHHFTPELVWIDGWRTHPNQVTDIARFVIAAQDPQAASEPYGRIFGTASLRTLDDGSVELSAGRATVHFISFSQAAQQYPGAHISPGDTLRMVALTLRTQSLDAVRTVLIDNDITPQVQTTDRIVIGADDGYGVVLTFVEDAA